MANFVDHSEGLQALDVRLARLEERGAHRDETLLFLREDIAVISRRMDVMGNDIRDAKTGLRIGLWFASTIVPAIAAIVGWFAHVLWPGR